ncbi:hypothetical protein C8J57DRAFT_1707023 [Mycena rebaudengoi]|nr:hypothetical protein C8J57DRAFT_1707023 [Mycena rebaudengoi]
MAHQNSNEHQESMYSRYDDWDNLEEQEYTKYTLDLGEEAEGGSGAVSPIVMVPPRRPASLPTASRTPDALKSKSDPTANDCGICFEYAVAPIRTRCCEHLFCAEHITAWLHGPASDGRCPSCRTLNLNTRESPPASSPPSPTSIPSHFDSASDSETASASELATSEEEDDTDYSFAALQSARALQSRRHAAHPLSSVLGVRGALGRLARAGLCILVVAVLAARGTRRWDVTA